MKFFIAFLLISNFLFSQNPSGEGIIFGKISDSKTSDPLEYVSVRLFNQIDSSLVTGVFTTQNGKFNFERIANGNYFIRLSLIEYEDFLVSDIIVSASLKIINLGTLRLIKEKISNLNEVKIEGKLNLLQTGIDKKVYNLSLIHI